MPVVSSLLSSLAQSSRYTTIGMVSIAPYSTANNSNENKNEDTCKNGMAGNPVSLICLAIGTFLRFYVNICLA
jgi:hypothetical protein